MLSITLSHPTVQRPLKTPSQGQVKQTFGQVTCKHAEADRAFACQPLFAWVLPAVAFQREVVRSSFGLFGSQAEGKQTTRLSRCSRTSLHLFLWRAQTSSLISKRLLLSRPVLEYFTRYINPAPFRGNGAALPGAALVDLVLFCRLSGLPTCMKRQQKACSERRSLDNSTV